MVELNLGEKKQTNYPNDIQAFLQKDSFAFKRIPNHSSQDFLECSIL